MTAVARFTFDKHPILLADLLTSGPARTGLATNLPTTSDFSVEFPPNPKRIPNGLRQKIALVSEHIALGWAGNVQAAQDIVEELKYRNAQNKLDMKSLDEFLNSRRTNVWQEIGIVGFLIPEEGGVWQFGRSYLKQRHDFFGHIGLLGSGGDALGDALIAQERDEWVLYPTSTGKMPQLNRGNQAVTFGLAVTGVLHATQVMFHAGLTNFYGGGYELAALNGSRIQKIDDIAYIFTTASISAEGEMYVRKVPFRVLRYKYDKDLLMIRALELIEAENGAFKAQHWPIYKVPPVYRYLTEAEKNATPTIPLHAQWYCIYLLVMTFACQPVGFGPENPNW